MPTHQACAACKHQRRKCHPGCILAPYFPHSNNAQFLNVHKLFGVKKIKNLLKHVAPSLRDTVMVTIIYQADARARDTVGGCYKIIKDLQYKIKCAEAELVTLHRTLAVYRSDAQQEDETSVSDQNGIGPQDLGAFLPVLDLEPQLV